MTLSPRITFRNMPPSEAVEQSIRRHIEGLGRFSDRLIDCRVVVEARHRRHRQGNLFHVRIAVTVPGGGIVVSREPAQHHAHEDVYVTLRDAFDGVRRQIEDHERRRRRKVKTHEVPPRGRVTYLDHVDGYGFLETPDGREIFFHRNSVLSPGFDCLEGGDVVLFHEEAGEKGPQATTIRTSERRAGAG